MKNKVTTWNILLFTIPIAILAYLIEVLDYFNADLLFTGVIVIIELSSVGLLIASIILSIERKKYPPKWKLFLIGLYLLFSTLIYYNFNGGFWGKKIIDATFLDDMSSLNLRLYENQKYILISDWLFGSTRYTGEYVLEADTIRFEHFPMKDNDFVSKKIVLKNDRIYFFLDREGNYVEDFYYFKIKN